jgi:hypothetical protein
LTRIAPLLSLLALSFLGCGNGDGCRLGDAVDIASPDKKWNAWVYTRECGPNSSVSVHVSLLAGQAALKNQPGNVFATPKPQSIVARWPNDRELLLEVDDLDTVVYMNAAVEDVRIDFRVP